MLSDQQTAAAHRQTGVSGDSKCPFTQNNRNVLSTYIEMLLRFSSLESKVGAPERRYSGQHIQISECSDPRHLRTHLSWLTCLNIDMLMVLSPVAMEDSVSLAPHMTGSSDFMVPIWNFFCFFHSSDRVVTV